MTVSMRICVNTVLTTDWAADTLLKETSTSNCIDTVVVKTSLKNIRLIVCMPDGHYLQKEVTQFLLENEKKIRMLFVSTIQRLCCRFYNSQLLSRYPEYV